MKQMKQIKLLSYINHILRFIIRFSVKSGLLFVIFVNSSTIHILKCVEMRKWVCVALLYGVYSPAIHAVRKQATLPAIIALMAMVAMSCFLSGAMADKAPIMIPIEPMLAKPHSA